MDEQIPKGQGDQMLGTSTSDLADKEKNDPLEKRMVSKNWSVRAGAYEELQKMCTDPNVPRGSKNDFFNQHFHEWKVYLKDSNPGALEKALTCLQAFLDKIHKSLITAESKNAIISMLVEKCISHMKLVIKDKGIECLLLIFEVSENFEESEDCLCELIKHKNVKV